MKAENKQNLYVDTGCSNVSNEEFTELARSLKAYGTVVGVFWDKRFEGKESPENLSFKDIARVWGGLEDVQVIPLSFDQIRSYEVLFNGKLDILVYPYDSVFPMDAFKLYSAQSFNHYLKKGGAVLTTGGQPFFHQAGPNGSVIPVDTPEQKTDVYDRWVSKFGIKYYELQHLPNHEKADADMFPSLAGIDRLGSGLYGFTLANSSHAPTPQPPHGNVFPERYPARQVIPLINGVDSYGATVSTAAVLAQDYEYGYRRIHFACEGESHPLNPERPHFEELMLDIFKLLKNKVFVKHMEAEYACYRQGEAVRLKAEIISHEQESVTLSMEMYISDESGVVYSESSEIKIHPGKQAYSFIWFPESFSSDEYRVDFRLCHDGQTLSRAYNGFAVWDDERISDNALLEIRDEYFTVGGKGTYITGTNYYESSLGELMWFRPNVANLISDFRQMRNSSINMIRPHYHHKKWFKDYLLYHYDRLFPYFESLGGYEDPQPDEQAFRIFDLFLYLCAKYGIIYNGDLFTLVPKEMGDPRGWFGTTEAVKDLNKREAQKEFLRILEKRYANMTCISWDLFNEPYGIPLEEVGKWALDLKSVWDELGSKRLITVGGPMSLGESTSYDCPHGKLSADFVNDRKKPVLLQELHIDYPEPLEMERQQKEDLRHCAVTSLRSGLAGICPWSWTRQQRLWQDAYEHHHSFPMEKWDDRLGIHTHEDGTYKLAGLFFKDFSILMGSMDIISYNPELMRVTTSRGEIISGIPDDENGLYTIHHANGNSCFAAMQYGEIAWNDILFETNNPTYMYFIAEAGFDHSKIIYLKSEAAGQLTIHRGNVKAVQLVDYVPGAERILANMAFKTDNDLAHIEAGEDMCRYWFKVFY